MISGKNFKGVPQQQPKNNPRAKLPKILQQPQQQQQSMKRILPSKTPKVLVAKPLTLSTSHPKEDIIIKEEVISIKEKALRLLNSENGMTGSIRIKFNHYNKSFPIYNGVLQWKNVDDEYSFSFVYKGQYSRDLIFNVIEKSGISIEEYKRDEKNVVLRDELGDYFIGLVNEEQYYAYIVEGAEGIGAEGLRLSSEPLKAFKDATLTSGNTQVKIITQELKAMNVKDLDSDEARRLKEARDLEDVLFS